MAGRPIATVTPVDRVAEPDEGRIRSLRASNNGRAYGATLLTLKR